MENFRKLELLANANKELYTQYGSKHIDIAMQDIDKVYTRNILSINADAKTAKGNGQGYLTGILYLAPAKQSGIEVCPGRSLGCTKACLFSAGRGRFYSVNRARVVKTLALHFDKSKFIETIIKSIRTLETKAKNKNMIPVVRLNGTSDIMVEHWNIIQKFSHIQFYDYTKIASRLSSEKRQLLVNYHLTFSLSENNSDAALKVLQTGGNVAVVFSDGNYPKTFLGATVINGDTTDLRFLDDAELVGAYGYVVALKAKGQAKKDISGFVQLTSKKVG